MEQFSLDKWLQDKSRKVVTRDGRPVRIICTDRKGKSGNIVGLVGEEESVIYVWQNDGTHAVSGIDTNDLFFADEEEELTEFEKALKEIIEDVQNRDYIEEVSFEIAQLLKEKGFNAPCHCYYRIKKLDYGPEEEYDNETLEFDEHKSYSAPTHQMALKYLREVHRKHICVRMRDFPTQYEIEVYDTKTGYLCHADFEHSFDSYEEAVEAAIKYTLENLI